MRESAIERHLVTVVRKLGGESFKFVSPGRRHVSDRIVVLSGGRIFFVELKQPGAKPRAGQVRFHGRLSVLGCNSVVLDTKEKIDAWAGIGDTWRTII